MESSEIVTTVRANEMYVFLIFSLTLHYYIPVVTDRTSKIRIKPGVLWNYIPVDIKEWGEFAVFKISLNYI